ncbi:M20 family peptidase [Clostridium sp. 19966]|uniref:M20 family peptidase n=1 Tax=Clostridium sp. 19966 TaxID=2768166 RepID=UPI0028E04DF8|nr:M20 family peptidase [Clostridium sp. 19966]MDT8715774.1 M20 family peptidase [Clostridium sp. 19966]
MKQEAISYLTTLKDTITGISKYIYNNPEESYHEYKSCSYICNILKENKFNVKEKYLDIDTAFYAQYGNGYPKICLLCEYDALLPEGHINGHNAVSAISVGAALGLTKAIDKLGGSIIVLGCPGEYIGGAKVTMAKQGTFKDIDLAMMVHPDVKTCQSGTSRAILPLSVKFKGSSGFTYLSSNNHSPMDACIFILNSINTLLKCSQDNLRIDSILSNGGYTPSLPSDVCEIKLYIRADKYSNAETIEKHIRNLSDLTANIMKLDCSHSIYELPYLEMHTNDTLSRLFGHNLKEIGIIDCCGIKNTESGLSIGNVSKLIPTIHPYVRVTEEDNIQYGTKQFADATISSYADEAIISSANALILTAIDLLEKRNLIDEIKSEFYKSK